MVKKLTPTYDQKVMEEIKNCTLEDIRKTAPILESALSHGEYCVIGLRKDIEKNDDFFGYIEEID